MIFFIFHGKIAIELDGFKFGTNNGTTDLIEMSRNLCPILTLNNPRY